MPNVKIRAKIDSTPKQENEEHKQQEIPTFTIKRIPGIAKQPTPVNENKNAERKISITRDFRKFIDKDVHLRERYSQLRRLAISLFCCSIASFGIAIADIEQSKTAQLKLADVLQCNDTYLVGYSRHCPSIDNPTEFLRDRQIEESVHEIITTHQSYFFRWLKSSLTFAYKETICTIGLKSVMTILTIISMVLMTYYHNAELAVLKLKRYLPQESSFWKSPKLRSCLFKLFLVFLHVPPLLNAWIPYEIQILVVSRVFVSGIKVLKECNELRYHRLGNVLSNLARIKIHGTFLIKTYFLRYPNYSLLVIYSIVLGIFPYFCILAERVESHPITYMDAWWLMIVTVTNLGSGEVRPRSIFTRIMVGAAAMVGILSTALWVNVFAKYMEIPEEEKRILSIVEHQRVRRLERNTAASCIQFAWKRYYLLTKKSTSKRRTSKEVAAEKLHKKSVWRWKCVRQYVSQTRRTFEQNFSAADTLIVARSVARRMSLVPKVVDIHKSATNLAWDRKSSSPFIEARKSSLFPNAIQQKPKTPSFHQIIEETSEVDVADLGLPHGGNRERSNRTNEGLQEMLIKMEQQLACMNANYKQMHTEAQSNIRQLQRSISHLKSNFSQ